MPRRIRSIGTTFSQVCTTDETTPTRALNELASPTGNVENCYNLGQEATDERMQITRTLFWYRTRHQDIMIKGN